MWFEFFLMGPKAIAFFYFEEKGLLIGYRILFSFKYDFMSFHISKTFSFFYF